MERRQDFKSLRREITILKNELQKITQEKENWFKEKEEFRKHIRGLIEEIRTVKNSKDSFNIVYNGLKTQRDNFNQRVKELIANVKKLRKDRKELIKKLNIKLDPEKIKERIKFFEEKIETEVLPFKKEEKLMGEIKILKKALSESSIIVVLDQKIESVSKLINEAKKKSQECHQKLKEFIKKHKKSRGYKDFINLSKQIEFLKSGQEKAFKMFIDFKTKFIALNRLLRHKLFEEKNIKKNIDDKYKRLSEEKRKEEERALEQKLKQAEEKLRTKKKLTTEDFVGFKK